MGLNIVAATFGGVDVTEKAREVFVFGDNLIIDRNYKNLPDTWDGKVKTLSLLISYNFEFRVFVTTEPTGRSDLIAGPIQASSVQPEATYVNVAPPVRQAGSYATILAVVWGKACVQEQLLYDYCYARMQTDQGVEFKFKFIPDPWHGKHKSGAIYYIMDNGDIRQICGKESETVPFNLRNKSYGS